MQPDPNASAQGLRDQNSFLQALKERGVALFGGGMAGSAANTLSADAYRKYVQEMQALNQTPLPPEQWAKTQQMQKNSWGM